MTKWYKNAPHSTCLLYTSIKPQEMKGEQKNLPELLKQVPGLHIIELKGRGAYTTASVRGSTASQVAVYVDGVLMNLGSEAAVDLSTIPVENVERIEVYRGYIPARFGGASMGGVINICLLYTSARRRLPQRRRERHPGDRLRDERGDRLHQGDAPPRP